MVVVVWVRVLVVVVTWVPLLVAVVERVLILYYQGHHFSQALREIMGT